MKNKIETSVYYDQIVKKLNDFGAYIAQILYLTVLYYFFPEYWIIYLILFGYSNVGFFGKILGTIKSMLIISKDKKN